MKARERIVLDNNALISRLLVLREPGRQALQRHIAVQAGVAGAIHLAHPARAELLQNLVMSERLADHREPPHPNATANSA